MRLRHAFCALSLIGCAHTQANQSGVYATPPQVYLASESGESMPLSDGQPLPPGQVFALIFELQQPAHAYVIHRRGGTLEGLYPGTGVADEELPAGTVRLPGRDTWMRVPAVGKQSRVCVLLSAQPLDVERRHCSAAKDRRPGAPPVQAFQLIPSRSL